MLLNMSDPRSGITTSHDNLLSVSQTPGQCIMPLPVTVIVEHFIFLASIEVYFKLLITSTRDGKQLLLPVHLSCHIGLEKNCPPDTCLEEQLL